MMYDEFTAKRVKENATLTARVAELESVLAWYGEQARLSRLNHSAGDAGGKSLADDGKVHAAKVLK